MELKEAEKILKQVGYLLEESEQLTLDDEKLKEKSDCADGFIHTIAGYTDKYFDGRT